MKKLRLFLAMGMMALIFSQCNYSFIIPDEPLPIDPENPDGAPNVSFSSDIVTIFNNNNKCTACHKTGGQIPDLTTAKAYSSINSTRYINSGSPENSLIYTKPHPDGSHGEKYSSAQAALVLLWIEQGAKNN